MEMIKIKTLTARERKAVAYAISLLTTDQYFIRYYQLVSGDLSSTEAFYAIESEVNELCGQNRYSDYNSFKTMRRRYVKKLEIRRLQAP